MFYATIKKKSFEDIINDVLDGLSSTMNNDTNIHETNEKYVLDISVPGYSKSDVDINVVGDQLHVNFKSKKSETVYSRMDFSTSKKNRIFSIPGDADTDGISASVENGILTVTINKKKPSETKKKVDIK